MSDYAQNQLGDVVFVELPAVGKEVQAGKAFGVVESVKAASDLFAPVSGKVVAINDAFSADPALLNKDAFGAGWLIKVKPSNPGDDGQIARRRDVSIENRIRSNSLRAGKQEYM